MIPYINQLTFSQFSQGLALPVTPVSRLSQAEMPGPKFHISFVSILPVSLPYMTQSPEFCWTLVRLIGLEVFPLFCRLYHDHMKSSSFLHSRIVALYLYYTKYKKFLFSSYLFSFLHFHVVALYYYKKYKKVFLSPFCLLIGRTYE